MAYKLSKLVDKIHKMKAEEFLAAAKEILGDKTKMFEEVLYVKSLDELGEKAPKSQGAHGLQQIFSGLKAAGIKNFVYDPSLVRGFDYYTGVVFEVFDTSPANNRSIFGGGRYDDLVGIFGVEKVPGVGFGAGDVTAADFLQTHGLMPEYRPEIDLYVCHLDGYLDAANDLADKLRQQGVRVAVDLTEKKVSQQVKTADKEQIPFVVVVGEEEAKTGKFKLKNLKQSSESEVMLDDLIVKLH